VFSSFAFMASMVGKNNPYLLNKTSYIFLAPPGYGKTSFMLDLVLNSQKKFIFISPLKEINLEIYERFKEKISIVLNPNLALDFNAKLFIVSAEHFKENMIKDRVIILDEIHLFYHWGHSFRPHLMEILYSCFNGENTLWTLTATLNKSIGYELKSDLLNNFETVLEINLGNNQLKNIPRKIVNIKQPFKKIFSQNWQHLINKNGKTLIFVRTRYEVDYWEEKLKKKFKKVIGCKSIAGFSWGQMIKNNEPDIIISTSVLSHGVNLKGISQVIITYEDVSEDFWLQMVARAGRNGEKFEIVTPISILKNNFIKDIFYNLEILIKMIYGGGKLW
jgi:ATP-dependent DNA helicase RecQ